MKKEKNYKINMNRNIVEVDLKNLKIKLTHKNMFNTGCFMPVDINHIFSNSLKKSAYGNGFTINLKSKIEKKDNSYIVILGDEQIEFKEKFYYILDNKRIYKTEQGKELTREDIEIDINGKLLYNGNEVFQEYQSDTNLKLKTDFKGFVNSEKLEFRSENIVSLEAEINNIKAHIESLKSARNDYNKVNQLNYKDMLEYQTEVETMSLQIEKHSLDHFTSTLSLRRRLLELTKNGIEGSTDEKAIKSYDLEKLNFDNTYDEYIEKGKLLNKREDYFLKKSEVDKDSDDLEINFENLVKATDAQILYYEKQLNSKEYELEELNKIYPETYIYENESLVYGFNKYGNLSMIFDSYDNKAIIEYDELNNIKKIVGSNEKTIDFKYENGLLKRIVDMDGKEVLFNYNDSNLTEIIYPNGDSVKYEYENNLLTRIIDVSGTSLKIEYDDGLVYRLLDVSKNNKEKAICFFEIEGNETILTDSDTHYKTHYMFSDDSLVFEYTMLNDELIETINYEYESECCKFIVETNKKDEVIFEVDDFEVSNLKSFYLSAEINKMISSDYVLIALLQADSYEVSDRRKTDYCNHQKDNMTDSHFDIECVLLYDEDERKSFVATGDYKNKGMQVVSVPISLKEENGNVILPEDIYLGVNYSNNQGTCKVEKLLLVKATYLYQELDLNGNVVYEENNDCITPKLVNGVKEGYYITKKISERIYDETLLTKEISTIKYKEINLDRNLILSNTKQTEIKYTYNSNKKVSLIETSEGNITEYSYNESGMVISKKEYHKSNPLLNYYEENKYDEEGFLKEEKDELGNVIKYEYENSDVVRIINPNNIINYGYDKKTGNKVAVSINVDDESLYNELEYNSGNVSKLVSNSNEYEYIYDDFNRLNEIKINGNTYVKFETEKVSGKRIEKTIYNNSKGFVKIYDNIGKLLEFNKLIDDVEIKYMKYEYDEFDQLIKEIDLINNKEKTYNYEEFSLASSNLGYIYNEEYDYKNNLIKKNYDNNTYDYIYEDDLLKKVKYNDGIISEYSYDKLRRIKVIENELIKDEYTYLTRNTNTTSLVTSVKKKVGNSVDHIKYKYDLSGNIINIKSKDNEISYKYDNAGRLIREDNKLLNKTFIYEYDNEGNILYKKKYDYSQNDILENEDVIEYNYDKDLLVNINNEAVKYDSLNNPVTYKDNILKWDLKNLIRFNDISFEYDSNGIRTIKQYNNYKHFYELDGSRIIKETIKSYDEFESPINSDQEYGLTEMEINYMYSSEGIVGFETSKNGVIKRYFYNKNILGDILEIYDNENKELVAKYVYDAYGNHEILVNKDNIANINPFRYRGYYYDIETGLYYCNYRYYSPKLCRWISPDSIEYLDPESINGLNLYVYCGNDPVNMVDPSGHFVITLSMILMGIGIGASIGAGIGIGTSLYQDYKDDKSINGSIGIGGYVGNILGGAVVGIGTGLATVLGAGVGLSLLAGKGLTILGISVTSYEAFGIGIAASALAAGTGYSLNTAINPNKNWSASQFAKEMVVGGINGTLSFVAGLVGGYTATRIPGTQVGLKIFAVRTLIEQEFTTPLKLLLSLLKNM